MSDNYACTLKYDGIFHPSLLANMIRFTPEQLRENVDQSDTVHVYNEHIMYDIPRYSRKELYKEFYWSERHEEPVVSADIQDCTELGLSVSKIVKCPDIFDNVYHMDESSLKVYISDFYDGWYNSEPTKKYWKKCYEFMDGLTLRMWEDDSEENDHYDGVEGGNDRYRYIIHISIESTEDIAVRAINTMIKTISERLTSMKYIEKKVSELKISEMFLEHEEGDSNTELIFGIHNQHMFLVRDHMTQFFGYLYNTEYIDDYVLIYGKSNEDGYVKLFPDMYNPDSPVNKVINLLYQSRDRLVPSYTSDYKGELVWVKVIRDTNQEYPCHGLDFP